MLVYVTRKPVNVVFGLDQDTAIEDSVTLLKTMSVADSGPKIRNVYSHFRNIRICTALTDGGS